VQAAVLVGRVAVEVGVVGGADELVTAEGDAVGEGLVDGVAVVGLDGVGVVVVGDTADGLVDAGGEGRGVGLDAVGPGAVGGGGGHGRFLPVLVWGFPLTWQPQTSFLK